MIHVLNKKTYHPRAEDIIPTMPYIDPTRIIYVGRSSILGNPYHHMGSAYSIWKPNDNPNPKIPYPIEAIRVESRETAILAFKDYMNVAYRSYQENLKGGREVFTQNMHGELGMLAHPGFVVRGLVWERLLQIAAKIKAEPNEDWGLMCWCAPLACHAEVIKEAIEWAIKKGKV